MNAITARTPQIIAVEINSIKNQTRQMVLASSIEIGRRLMEAKQLVQHGNWEAWLKDNIDYSTSTANNLMRIFEAYGADQISLFGETESQALGDLSYTQAVALLGIPAEEREAFVKDNDMANISTRELQQLIKDKADAENKAVAAKADAAKALLAADEQERANKKALDDVRIYKKQAETMEASLKDAKEKNAALTDELAKPVTLEPAVVEKVPEELLRQLEDLKMKANPAAQQFQVYFEQLASGFKTLLSILQEVKARNPEYHERFKGAVSKLTTSMSERLEKEVYINDQNQ
jgi:hypothetical protein